MDYGALEVLCGGASCRLLRRAYADEVRIHVELAAVEKDDGAEVLEVAVSLGRGLECLYRRVESLREGVVDAAVEPCQKAVEVLLQHVGHLDHVLEAGFCDLFVPEREVRLRHELVAALPEPSEQLLERPGPACVESAFQQVVPVGDGLVAHVLETCQPEILALGEALVVRLQKAFVLALARVVHALVEMGFDVVLVEHHVRAGHELAHGALERGGHVHRHAAHHVPLERVQRLLYQSRGAFLASAARDVQHAMPVNVGHEAGERLGVLALQKALLVHADEGYLLGVAPCEAALHGCGHDLMRLEPAQAKQFPRVLDAPRGLEDAYRERLEEKREARAFLGPWKLDDLDLVVGASDARRPGVDQRLELHRVEMPPCPLGLLVVKRHQPAAYRTYRGALRIFQPDVDSTCGNVQLHVGYVPLLAKSEKCCIVPVENVFHADIVPQMRDGCMARSRGAAARTPTVGVSTGNFQAALSTKNSEEPNNLGILPSIMLVTRTGYGKKFYNIPSNHSH